MHNLTASLVSTINVVNVENISAPAIAEAATSIDNYALGPAWFWLRANYGHILASPLWPPVFALSIDYFWVVLFTCELRAFDATNCHLLPFFKSSTFASTMCHILPRRRSKKIYALHGRSSKRRCDCKPSIIFYGSTRLIELRAPISCF